MKLFHSSQQKVMGLLLTGSVLALFGCGGSGDKAQLRAMDATPQESKIDVSLNSKTLASGIAYGTASSYYSVSSGSRHLQIYPAGIGTPYIDKTVSLDSAGKYTVLSANVLSSANTILLADEKSKPASNTAELRIVNASPDLGTVDVYIISPGTSLGSVSPTISGLAFEAYSTYQSLTVDTSYEIYLTVPNQKTALLDSGAVKYSNGEVRTMVALNGEAGGYTLTTLKDLN